MISIATRSQLVRLVVALLILAVSLMGAVAPSFADESVDNSPGEAFRQSSSGLGSLENMLKEGGPTITNVRVLAPSATVGTYDKLEIAFDLDTVATNPYFPYDADPPVGVEPEIGVTTELVLLAPGETEWDGALVVPAFYYQPVEEVGTGAQAALLPVGASDWRARFSTGTVGVWQFKIRAVDASGTRESSAGQFTVVLGDNSGYVRVSATESQAFELSDGTAFASPLVTARGGYFTNLQSLRERIPELGANGINLLRWFPTGEHGQGLLNPFSDSIQDAWRFGGAWHNPVYPDTETDHEFSYRPYYYTAQYVPAVVGDRYRLSFRAKVEGEWVLRAEMTGLASIDIGSTESTIHEANGQGDTLDYRQDGWHSYVMEVENPSRTGFEVAMRLLYGRPDAPEPYGGWESGYLRLSTIVLQRDETGNGDWGPNLLNRSDPDTHEYVDQRASAMMDELFTLSEEHGVYHKLTMFQKNDNALNRMLDDGSLTLKWDGDNVPFYSGLRARWHENAYTRYFVARWGYSTALHSLELANENHLTTESYEAGWAFAEYVRELEPRHIMVSNSFWGYFVSSFFGDAEHGDLLDYGDQHWYASEAETTQGLVSNTWDDSAQYVREAWQEFSGFRQYFEYDKPIMRGESGVAESGTEPQHPDIELDPTGTYYHKKVWAYVGSPRYQLDGEWYARLDATPEENKWPNDDRNTLDVYATYARYIEGEPINNGYYENIGTDLTGDVQIVAEDVSGEIRAWGVRDSVNGSVLLWIDNATHTWKHVVDGDLIAPATANLVLQGLPSGTYDLEWWDTTLGQASSVVSVDVSAEGTLDLPISSLASDVALKLNLTGQAPSTATPTPTDEPSVTATPTNTPVPPTATPTNTPVPPTATPTNTPVPPTATPTNTPVPPTATPTNTPVPPTATPTNTPVPPTATPGTVHLVSLSPSEGVMRGGTALTILGQGFSAGAAVMLGDKPCTSVNVVSGNQIHCTSPEHNVAELVDLSVTNLDGGSDTLVSGYQYTTDRATLVLGDAEATLGLPFDVTLLGQNLGGVVAMDLVVTYDTQLLSPNAVVATDMLDGWAVQSNLTVPGEIRISMASGGMPLIGSGDLVRINLDLLDDAQPNTTLYLSSAVLNDGAIPRDTDNGVLTIDAKRAVSGRVSYWSSAAPVGDVAIALVDGQDHATISDKYGDYVLEDASREACRLTAFKDDDTDAISAYDAALVLQHAAASITLEGAAWQAGDVNKSGAISAMDAYYILQKAVGSISLPFPGSDRIWEFAPGDYVYTAVEQDLLDQDFTAVLIGDVSGNWGNTLGAASVPTGASLDIVPTLLGQSGAVALDLMLTVGEQPIDSLDLTLNYDPAAFELVKVFTNGVAAKAQWNYYEPEPGTLNLACASTPPIESDGLLVRLTMRQNDSELGAIMTLDAMGNEGGIYIATHDCSLSSSARPDRTVR